MPVPLLYFREERQTRHDSATAERVRKSFACRRCGTAVSDTDALFPKDGEGAVRVFSNPYGLLCEILTLRRAENLVAVGPPTWEFTWFAGYAWEIVLCQGCQTHLGWRFSGDGEPREFWGLLRDGLVEG